MCVMDEPRAQSTASSDAAEEVREQRCLLAQAQSGDERAFIELVEPHRRGLELHCYRMLGSLHDAEDVAQETLLRAWRRIEDFERRAKLRTWLFRIATNACLDELDRRPRRPEPVDPYPDDRLDEAAKAASGHSDAAVVDPAARYAANEGVELAFLTAIQRLPGRQRATLILRDVLGWTAPEVAELLDSTVAGVNSSLQRARGTIDGELPARSTTAAAPSDRALLASYIDAWRRADMDALVDLLREDAVLRMPPQESLQGAITIGEFFRDGACGGGFERILLEGCRANGRPAVAMWTRAGDAPDSGYVPHGVLVLDVSGGEIAGFDAYIDAALPGRFASMPLQFDA